MFCEWLGEDQTIDLRQWAMCVGVRRTYLETLPRIRWVLYALALGDERTPPKALRVTLDDCKLYLQLLPHQDVARLDVPTGDIASVASRLSANLPADPPVLATIVLDGQAASCLAISFVAEPVRAAILRTRLAEGYGEHWSVQAVNPLVQRLVIDGLTQDWRALCQDLAQGLDGKTIIWHRDGSPATRGGTRFERGQFHLLAPEELVSVPDAIWLDERLIGASVTALDRAVRRPQTRSALSLRLSLIGLFLRGYLRPGDKPPPFRWLISALIAGRRKRPSPQRDNGSAGPVQRPALKLALYVQLGPPATSQDAKQDKPPFRLLLEALARHPQVKATIGWTRAALHDLSAGPQALADAYGTGVEGGQFESVCVACARPFPLLTTGEMIRVPIAFWKSAARRTSHVQAVGLAPIGKRLSPGWSVALRDEGYRYLVLDETEVRHACPHFDPTQPLSAEGWAVVGLHDELRQVLGLDLDGGVLTDYLRHLRIEYDGKMLTAVVHINRASDVSRLDRFLHCAETQGCSFVLLSDVAGAPSQGPADLTPRAAALEPWIGSEMARRLNALIDQVWYCCQSTQALRTDDRVDERASPEMPRIQPPEAHRAAIDLQVSEQGDQFLTSDALEGAISKTERAAVECQGTIQRLLDRNRAFPTPPAGAIGIIRVFEPSDMDRESSALEIEIPAREDGTAETWAFVDNDLSLPSQFVGYSDGMARFVLVTDTKSGSLKDLAVVPAYAKPVMRGLDITSSRLCNPQLAVLLDQSGQITSIRYQGQERLCGPSNTVRGYLLETGEWLRPEREHAEIEVTEHGPLRGSITVRQVLTGGVELTRHMRLTLFSPLLECVTEIEFPAPLTLGGPLIVGRFNLIGEEMSWALPLQAGTVSQTTAQATSPLFAAEDTIDVQTGPVGLRYLVHRPTTRTFCYQAAPIPGGLGLGLIASMPGRRPDPRKLPTRSGLGFPGHVYVGRHTYRYAVLPLAPDVEARGASYNTPLLWTFRSRQDIPT